MSWSRAPRRQKKNKLLVWFLTKKSRKFSDFCGLLAVDIFTMYLKPNHYFTCTLCAEQQALLTLFFKANSTCMYFVFGQTVYSLLNSVFVRPTEQGCRINCSTILNQLSVKMHVKEADVLLLSVYKRFNFFSLFISFY